MFAHLTLATTDVARTAAFFHETLGWRPIHQPGNIELDAAWLEMAPGQQLHILRIAGFQASPFEAEFGRHFAIFRPGAEFAELRDRLARNGAELMAPIRATPFARFFFRDPNGYVFEVIDRDGYVAE